jgi:hypothetical protein
MVKTHTQISGFHEVVVAENFWRFGPLPRGEVTTHVDVA